MKKRYVYAVLWAVPGLFVAGIGTMMLFGMLAGVLWLYIFGDNTWPASTGPILGAFGVITFLFIWMGFIIGGYLLGKRLESDPSLNRKHILLSAGLTLLFLSYLLIQQFSVGNLGPKTDSLLCSDFCVQRGYSGSGTPPLDSGERTCSCYDASGKEAIKVPLESIEAETVK